MAPLIELVVVACLTADPSGHRQEGRIFPKDFGLRESGWRRRRPGRAVQDWAVRVDPGEREA